MKISLRLKKKNCLRLKQKKSNSVVTHAGRTETDNSCKKLVHSRLCNHSPYSLFWLEFLLIFLTNTASLIVQLVKNRLQCRRPGFNFWDGKICWRRGRLPTPASLVAQTVKNLPAMWETWVRSLGWEDPLEKGKATHSSILAWRSPWTV